MQCAIYSLQIGAKYFKNALMTNWILIFHWGYHMMTFYRIDGICNKRYDSFSGQFNNFFGLPFRTAHVPKKSNQFIDVSIRIFFPCEPTKTIERLKACFCITTHWCFIVKICLLQFSKLFCYYIPYFRQNFQFLSRTLISVIVWCLILLFQSIFWCGW